MAKRKRNRSQGKGEEKEEKTGISDQVEDQEEEIKKNTDVRHSTFSRTLFSFGPHLMIKSG